MAFIQLGNISIPVLQQYLLAEWLLIPLLTLIRNHQGMTVSNRPYCLLQLQHELFKPLWYVRGRIVVLLRPKKTFQSVISQMCREMCVPLMLFLLQTLFPIVRSICKAVCGIFPCRVHGNVFAA